MPDHPDHPCRWLFQNISQTEGTLSNVIVHYHIVKESPANHRFQSRWTWIPSQSFPDNSNSWINVQPFALFDPELERINHGQNRHPNAVDILLFIHLFRSQFSVQDWGQKFQFFEIVKSVKTEQRPSPPSPLPIPAKFHVKIPSGHPKNNPQSKQNHLTNS